MLWKDTGEIFSTFYGTRGMRVHANDTPHYLLGNVINLKNH